MVHGKISGDSGPIYKTLKRAELFPADQEFPRNVLRRSASEYFSVRLLLSRMSRTFTRPDDDHYSLSARDHSMSFIAQMRGHNDTPHTSISRAKSIRATQWFFGEEWLHNVEWYCAGRAEGACPADWLRYRD